MLRVISFLPVNCDPNVSVSLPLLPSSTSSWERGSLSSACFWTIYLPADCSLYHLSLFSSFWSLWTWFRNWWVYFELLSSKTIFCMAVRRKVNTSCISFSATNSPFVSMSPPKLSCIRIYWKVKINILNLNIEKGKIWNIYIYMN